MKKIFSIFALTMIRDINSEKDTTRNDDYINYTDDDYDIIENYPPEKKSED